MGTQTSKVLTRITLVSIFYSVVSEVYFIANNVLKGMSCFAQVNGNFKNGNFGKTVRFFSSSVLEIT